MGKNIKKIVNFACFGFVSLILGICVAGLGCWGASHLSIWLQVVLGIVASCGLGVAVAAVLMEGHQNLEACSLWFASGVSIMILTHYGMIVGIAFLVLAMVVGYITAMIIIAAVWKVIIEVLLDILFGG